MSTEMHQVQAAYVRLRDDPEQWADYEQVNHRIRNLRRDRLHKLTTGLAATTGTVVPVEDLLGLRCGETQTAAAHPGVPLR